MKQCQLLVPQYEILYNIERELRNLSTQLQMKSYDDRYRKKAANMTQNLIRDIIEDLRHDLDIINHDYAQGDSILEPISNNMYNIIKTLEKLNVSKDIADDFISQNTNKAMDDLESTIKLITKQNCRYNVKSSAGLINDLASCTHRLADSLQYILDSKKVSKKCIKSKSIPNNDILVKACKEWDKFSNKLNRKNLYNARDYDKLRGRVIPNRLMLVVGSSDNHQTHIDLERGIVEYYDEDTAILDIMSRLFRDIGLKCEKTPNGLKCIGLTKDNVINASRIAALATSMDLRVEKRQEEYEQGYYYDDDYDEIDEDLDKLRKRAYKIARTNIVKPDIKYVLKKLNT